MIDAAESLCPHVMKRSNLRPELMKASSDRMVVPKSFVTKTLLEQSGMDIINKIRCLRACWFERVYFYVPTTNDDVSVCQFFLVFSFIFPVYLLKNNLFLCQWGKTKSCLLSYGSHRWWDFGGSLCVATHSGKWKTRFSLNWLIPTFILSKMFHYRVSPPVLVFQADHLVRRGRPLVRHESVDHDIPEERISKRASAEILEAERLDDLEACMVSLVNKGVRGASADCIIVLFENWGISQLETAFLFNKSAHKHRNGKNSISAEHWICSKLPKTNLIYQYYIYWPA